MSKMIQRPEPSGMSAPVVRGTPPLRDRAPAVAVLALAAALAVGYAVLLTWPMRIWHRPVSPNTHLVGTFGLGLEGALRYVLTVLVLFALYGGALWLVLTRRARPAPVVILGAAAVFCAILLGTHPLTSTDVFNYIVSARVLWVHEANPLTTPALTFPNDPFFGLLTHWQHLASPYGPLWSVITGLPVRLGGDDPLRTVLAFKAVSALFFLAASWLVYLTARRLRPDSAVPALLVFSWNPLALFHVAGNGHNDAVMVFFVALFLYLLARGWAGAALLALTASALVKYASLLVVPLLVVWWLRSRERPGARELALGVGGSVLLAAAVYAPFWSGADTFATTLDEGSYFSVSVPTVIRDLLAREMARPRAEWVTTWLVRGVFLALYGWIALRLRGDRPARLIEAGALAYFAYLTVAGTYFAPWYVLWPLLFAALLPYRRDVLWPVLTLSLTAMAVLVAAVWFRERFAPDPRAEWWAMELFAGLAVYPLPVLVWLWAVRYPPGTPIRRAALRREARHTRAARPHPRQPRTPA